MDEQQTENSITLTGKMWFQSHNLNRPLKTHDSRLTPKQISEIRVILGNKKSATQMTPPQAIEVEESILGAMLLSQEAVEEALIHLRVDDLYKPAHVHIFKAIAALTERGDPVDTLTVETELRKMDLIDEIGGTGTLADLVRSPCSFDSIQYNCRVIEEKAMLRNLILGNSEINKYAYRPDADPYEALDKEAALLDRVTNKQVTDHGGLVRDYIVETIDDIDRARKSPGHITGVPSGLDIDNLTAGWQPGDLIIIAARPSMGKTALALTMGYNAATHKDENLRSPGMIFSLEMSNKKLLGRFIGITAQISQSHITSGRITDDEFDRICGEVAQELYELNIYLDDTPGMNLRVMQQKVRRGIRKYGIKWVMVDYLQLMQSGDKSENRTQEVGQISRGLKQMAKQFDIPVIALSQLSRQVEHRSNKRPQLADLRDSGEIEQDADAVLFLYRPEYYNITVTEDGSSTDGLAEVILAKQRNGPLGAPKIRFQKEYGRFVNMEHRHYDDNYTHDEPDTNYRSPLPPEKDETDAPF